MVRSAQRKRRDARPGGHEPERGSTAEQVYQPAEYDSLVGLAVQRTESGVRELERDDQLNLWDTYMPGYRTN